MACVSDIFNSLKIILLDAFQVAVFVILGIILAGAALGYLIVRRFVISKEDGSVDASVLTTVLKMIDKYDLYGQVAYPKHHKQSDVPEIYRYAARTKV